MVLMLKRVLIKIGYLVAGTLVVFILTQFLLSPDCLDNDRCSGTRNLITNATLGVAWIFWIGMVISSGGEGRLPGMSKKSTHMKKKKESGKRGSPGNPLEMRANVEDLPKLNTDEYRSIVERIPRPTEEQIENFANYFTGAKSWYKHLGLFLPGTPVTFYIDPWAGLDRILLEDGRVVHVVRKEQSVKFHYTWMTTDNYREKFGRLAFACDAGTELFLPVGFDNENGIKQQGVLANNPSRPTIYLSEQEEFRLPDPVIHACTVNLTAVIHENAFSSPFWDILLLEERLEKLDWPEDSGGKKQLRAIASRYSAIYDRNRKSKDAGEYLWPGKDEELKRLVEPERQRQKMEIIKAIRRAVAIYNKPKGSYQAH